MPRQFYVNGTRAIRARSNYGESINADYSGLPRLRSVLTATINSSRTG